MKRFTSATATALLIAAAAPAASAQQPVVARSYGPDRITTAVEASQDFRSSATDALLTTATNFPDALAAGALANRLAAPLLLTDVEALPPAVADELARLTVRTVWILGGPEAVSPAVEADLVARGYTVNRLAGDSRYATARQIAEAAGSSATGEVVLALGEHSDPSRAWPDAVASGALAATPDRVPTLLTRSDALPVETEDALRGLQARTVLLLGGEAVIGAAVEARLVELGYAIQRIAGNSRYGTSVALADDALERFDGGVRPAVFASGQSFPDALSAGALAASLGAPLVLVPQDALPATSEAFLRAHEGQLTNGVVIGGPAAAGDYVVAQIDAAIQGQPAPAAPAPAPAPEPPPPPEQTAPEDEVVGVFEGRASWYGPGFDGRPTASGEPFNRHDLTAAHRSLAFGTRLRITNLANGNVVEVRINDRGPFNYSRVLDLSQHAAEVLGYINDGTAPVRAEILAEPA